MSLRIEPGSRVAIDVLARELGVSQTPIRDALNRMEAEGLVVRVPMLATAFPLKSPVAGSRTCSRSACSSVPTAVRRAVPAVVRRGQGCGRSGDEGLTGGLGRGMIQSDRIGSTSPPTCEEKQVPRALLLTGDAAEELDTMYPYYRVQEGGWDVDVSSRTMRDVQL
ncbi:GntR family transcriptional regulator, partial [Phytohabitans houttuyneae]|uniref:GntR family transcriptional regulator n=1 Tax=Phytohabitans houttuyneae TaxID=1076126 RepID=UPI0031F19235